MSRTFFDDIIEHKKKLIASKQHLYGLLKQKLTGGQTRYQLFKRALIDQAGISIIAEVKKASPSKGVIRSDFDPVEIAKIYESHHAKAISVLTEEKFFLGDMAYLKKIADTVKVPVLAKDFFIDEGQLFEAAFYGASAVLLIAAMLSDSQMKDFIGVASRLDLDCLVEVHDQDELDRAVKIGAEIIGINNRDLQTFNVDINTAFDLIRNVPSDKVVVVESGITSHEDIVKLSAAGCRAFLIGESLMRAPDIGRKLDEFLKG